MKCCVCKKEFNDGFKSSDGKKYCSEKCLQYGDSFNYGIRMIIQYRLKCLDYLPISDEGKAILKKHINPEELFNDVVTIGKEKNIVSERDIAISIARGIYLPSVAPVTSESKPGIISSEADLKIYGYKLASIKARVKYTESLLQTIFSYEDINYMAEEKVIDFKQIASKGSKLKALAEKYKEQRDSLFRKLAKKAGSSDSDIATTIGSGYVASDVIKGTIKMPVSYLTNGGKTAIAFNGEAAAMSLSIPIAGLIAVGGMFYYLYNRKNRIIAEGIAEAQAVYAKRIYELKVKFNSWLAKSKTLNQKMDQRILNIKNEIIESEMAIAEYKLDIAMFSEMEKLNN